MSRVWILIYHGENECLQSYKDFRFMDMRTQIAMRMRIKIKAIRERKPPLLAYF